jgi:hypothetical protein
VGRVDHGRYAALADDFGDYLRRLAPIFGSTDLSEELAIRQTLDQPCP